MTLHLIKLSVGSESLDDLVLWQKQRLKEKKAQGLKAELIHPTRQWPRKADEVLDGGSIYWVIKGFIVGRQRLVEFREVAKNGIPHCGLVYDSKMIPVRMTPRKAFQGWRYLEAKDAPPDRKQGDNLDEMPAKMKKELADLGLL